LIVACIFCTRYARSLQKNFFRENYKVDQIDQNLVSLLSIRRKLIVQYCFKIDHLLKFVKCCTSLDLSFRTLVNKLKYIKLEASKNDQLWDSTVQLVFVWLIKAKRDFDQLDQFYNFHEKKIFFSACACWVQALRAGKKKFFYPKVSF
jgi:hypothetical protein